ncbi:MAG: hypothetical protein ACXWPM_01120 [Bdellovibrionota bacterium]
MDAHRLNRFRKAAIWYANKHGLAHLAEDFGSYVIETVLSKGLDGINLRFARFNFIQEMSGRNGTYHGDSLSLEQEEEVEDGAKEVSPGIPGEDPSPADFAQACRELKFDGGMDRIVFLLEFEYGFSNADLEHIFGLSRARVNQLRRSVDAQVVRMYGKSNKTKHPGGAKRAAREFLEWEAKQHKTAPER